MLALVDVKDGVFLKWVFEKGENEEGGVEWKFW